MENQSLITSNPTILLFLIFLFSSLTPSHAGVYLSESFETYNLGPLDADLPAASGGVNAATNGAFSANPAVFINPWWGAEPPNLFVVGIENGVHPHTGNKMVRGASTNSITFSQDLYNLSYRANGPTPFQGNVLLDWWFYDPAGNGPLAAQFQDSISLVYYPNLPINLDYSDPGFFGFASTEQFAIGGASEQTGAYNSAKYQVQCVGSTAAYDGTAPSAGWINTTNTRSIGWHHARITFSPATNGLATVSYYIDDLSRPTVTNSTVFTNGVNCIEMDASVGGVSAYYDDLTFDLLQHATLSVTHTGKNIVLRWPAGWTLQTTPNNIPSNFVDLGVTSPYTNQFPATHRFFRLRSGNPNVLRIAISGKNYIVNYPSGWTLQTSANLALPSSFSDVPNATNPYTNQTTATPQFFRAHR